MTDRPDGTNRTGEASFKAEDGRKMWAELLSRTQWQGQHVTITRSGRRASVMVPPDWYDRAVAALATQEDSPTNLA